jgi:hypothetical protein
VKGRVHPIPPRHRSVGFLEKGGESWACFLVTFREGERWHGYFAFRRGDGELGEGDVRTADIFLEDEEAEIERKARGLGRPLLAGLLASALHAAERRAGGAPPLRRWFRDMLAEGSLMAQPAGPTPPAPASPGELRSLYASYRLDQVAHFIALVKPEDFHDAVTRILEGQTFDFGARDRLQFAMLVIEFIERRLPLPPFEVWMEDYLSDPTAYRLYAHTLHREGRLP